MANSTTSLLVSLIMPSTPILAEPIINYVFTSRDLRLNYLVNVNLINAVRTTETMVGIRLLLFLI